MCRKVRNEFYKVVDATLSNHFNSEFIVEFLNTHDVASDECDLELEYKNIIKLFDLTEISSFDSVNIVDNILEILCDNIIVYRIELKALGNYICKRIMSLVSAYNMFEYYKMNDIAIYNRVEEDRLVLVFGIRELDLLKSRSSWFRKFEAETSIPQEIKEDIAKCIVKGLETNALEFVPTIDEEYKGSRTEICSSVSWEHVLRNSIKSEHYSGFSIFNRHLFVQTGSSVGIWKVDELFTLIYELLVNSYRFPSNCDCEFLNEEVGFSVIA